MAIYSGFTHYKWWFSIAMLIYQTVLQDFKDHHLGPRSSGASASWTYHELKDWRCELWGHLIPGLLMRHKSRFYKALRRPNPNPLTYWTYIYHHLPNKSPTCGSKRAILLAPVSNFTNLKRSKSLGVCTNLKHDFYWWVSAVDFTSTKGPILVNCFPLLSITHGTFTSPTDTVGSPLKFGGRGYLLLM